MNISSFNEKNPKTHEYIANHEMGHKVVADHRWNDWEKDVDMDNAVDKSCKKLKININNGFSHGKNKDEYLADYYAINHTKNGEKVMKDTFNSLNKSLKKITDKDIPEKKKRELYEKGISKKDISKKLKINKQFVKNESNNRRKIVNDLKNNKDIDFLKD